ncbi:antistasin-like isoform X2 [Haliotis asinina]|uniref:antistasin-like isoform X2 n=1 Tax=Haliotis asinina TaxID=109174 RepID=UPI0035321817
MLKLTVSIAVPAAIVVCLAVHDVQGAANVPAVSLPPIRPVCGPVCAIFCECGNIPDERGCPTCRCRPCGPTFCPSIRCARPIECPFGVKKVNGCPTCECNPGTADCSKIGCPPNVAIKCLYGIKIINGCPSCSCNTGPVCPERRCPRICKNGFKMVNGCQSCLCNPGPVCPKRRCPRICKYGFKMVNGCQSCLCNPGPSTCPKIHCPFRQVCRYGVRKVNGCPTCSCETPICPRLARNSCRRRCPSGDVILRSLRGCPTCVCRRGRGFADAE